MVLENSSRRGKSPDMNPFFFFSGGTVSLYMVLSIYLSFCSDHSILGGSSVLHAPRAVRQTRKTHAGGRVAEAAHSAHPGKMREFWCFSSPPVNCLPMVLSLLSCFSLYGSPCSDCAAPHVPLRQPPIL